MPKNSLSKFPADFNIEMDMKERKIKEIRIGILT